MKRYLGIFAMVAGTSLLAFVFTDCAAGRVIDLTVTVVDKEHIPAHTSTSTWVDSDGNLQQSTTHYPDEYQLVTTSGSFACRVGIYESTKLGDQIVASMRKGRWTGWTYLPHVSGEKQQ